MPAIGSSSRSSRGLVASAMAISSWRCSPWLSRSTRVPARACQSDGGERGHGRLAQGRVAPRVSPEAERVAGMRLHRERDIVERGEIGKQRGDLERARQPEPAPAIGGKRGDVAAVEADAAAFGCNLAGQQPDQRGLAGAVRADDGVEFAALQCRARSRRRRPRRRSAWSGPRPAAAAQLTARSS